MHVGTLRLPSAKGAESLEDEEDEEDVVELAVDVVELAAAVEAEGAAERRYVECAAREIKTLTFALAFTTTSVLAGIR